MQSEQSIKSASMEMALKGFFVGAGVGIVLGAVITANSWSITQMIDECEANLPRHQSCDWKAVAFVKESE